MEGLLFKTLSENIQDEAISQNQGPGDFLESEPTLSSTPVDNEKLELNANEETNGGVNGHVDVGPESFGDNKHLSESALLQQKSYSPTLIESAFKVMKNLFSPDKTKGKPTNKVSPCRQHQSSSGSPSSICVPSKTEFGILETGIENPLAIQTGESSMKSQLSMNQVGVLFSPLALESHNNTDESFLTTVSIIDDSFHSAITNLDENGETMKLETNVTDNFLNNTQNSDVGDPYNDTLEVTTLRNGSFASDGTKVENASVLSKDGSGECWVSSQVSKCNGSFLDDCRKGPVNEVELEALKTDHSGGTPQRTEAFEDSQPLRNGHTEDNTQAVSTDENSSTTCAQAGANDLDGSMQNVKMENLFLNKSFDTSKGVSGSPKECLQPSSAYESDAGAGEMKMLQLDGWDRPVPKEIEAYAEGSKDERDICLDSCFSTTTFVLKSVDSSDAEMALMALKDNTSEADTLSSTCSITPITSCENQLSKELDNFDLTSTNIGIAETNSTLVHKPQKNRSSISDKGTPGTARNISKIKSHKSDELLNHRILSESSEGKRIGHKKKSSLDVPLIKNIEATKNLHPETSSDCAADFGASELNVHAKETSDKPEKSAVSKSPATVPVISQQSYTVLDAHEKKLNRPVIEPLNFDKDFPQKLAFQTNDSGANCSAQTESCSSSSYCNSSLNAGGSATPSQQKQSTPLMKGSVRHSSGENCQAVVKSISLELSSRKESTREKGKEEEFPSTSSKCEVLEKTVQMPNSNEDPAEFSPVNPITENELIFSNSVESEIEGSQFLNGTRVLSSNDPGESSRAPKGGTKKPEADTAEGPVCQLNQTFDKKQVCPVSSVRTLEGALGCDKLNVTFDKSTDSLVSNQIFNKDMESLEMERINQTFYVSESPESINMNKTVNKTSVNRGAAEKASGAQKLNETFQKSSQSPLPGKADQTFDVVSASSVPGASDQTFVKEKASEGSQRKTAQEMNKTFEVTPVSEAADGKNVEGEAQEDVEGRLSGNQSKGGEGPKDSPAERSIDQQVSDFVEGCHRDMNGSFVSGRSSNTSLVGSELSALLLSEGSLSRNQSLEDLAGKLSKLNLNESLEGKSVANGPSSGSTISEASGGLLQTEEHIDFIESASDDKLKCDPYLVQLIQEQFSSNDIEKICSVVEDFSAIKLSSQILKASEQFDKSFHENVSTAESKPAETEENPEKLVNPLSPKSFDFLSSIQGKPTGRDWSRESLYVKFDPLVQPNPNSLIDFTKEGEALTPGEKSPQVAHDSSVCEQLLSISPQKKPDDIVPPLTPLSHKSKGDKGEDKTERIKELQNEIYFLKNLYAERERGNKAKMEEYESQVAKLTGESCFLEDRLKESSEREKALVKKMKEQNQGLGQLKIIMEEYVKVISKLTAELEALKTENQEQVHALATEKDSYETHLQNTEAAFTDVHAKYEKSKKTIVSLKANEAMYRSTIAEQAQKMEELKSRAREAQEKAFREFQKVQEELNESKATHGQETARLRAQLRKTELKVEALQESLEQKIKENQQLTAICDELIEGKK